MKKLIPLLTLVFFISNLLNAQVSEEEKSMSLGVKNALVLELPGTTEKIVEKQWKKYAKKYKGKTKRNKKADEYFTDNAEIVSINGANTLDLYYRVVATGETVYFTSWYDLGGTYLNSTEHPDQYTEAEKILMRFAIEVAKEMTRRELDDEEDKAKKLEKQLKRLQNDNSKYHKSIEKARQTIAENESKIETNVIEQEDTNKQIELQREVIDGVKQRLSDL